MNDFGGVPESTCLSIYVLVCLSEYKISVIFFVLNRQFLSDCSDLFQISQLLKERKNCVEVSETYWKNVKAF